jgi:IS30 family transposase
MQSYSHFTIEDRLRLEKGLREGLSITELARMLNKSRSAIHREMKRNQATRETYCAVAAQLNYEARRLRCKRHPRLQASSEETNRICHCLEKKRWSPEIISNIERKKHGVKIGISTIYRYIKAGRFPGLTEANCLRRGGKRKYCRGGGKTIQPLHTIHERSNVIEQRARIGDWEGDTVLGGVGKGCLLTLVDRKSRFLIACVMKSKSAKETEKQLTQALSEVKVYSVTLDNGSEFARFKEIEAQLGAPIYFADTHSPWQRGSNENLNGLIRWDFPKGFDFRNLSSKELDEIVKRINNRPRKCLGWKTPEEVFKVCGT